MKAIITGASSGIGKDMAHILSNKGYDLFLVSRDKKKLQELKQELKTEVTIVPLDLSNVDNCYKLYKKVKDEDIDIIINNAGFGDIGLFNNTDLDNELNMIDLNIKALHILTKLFYKKFIKSNKGYILNVSSSAAFLPGPLMATYYSTKSYVYNLTLALYEEIRRNKYNIHVSCLCPGPVNTNFNKRANCEFKVHAKESKDVASYAIDKMFKNKLLIIPGFEMKLLYFFVKLIPNKIKLRMVYNTQHSKIVNK